MLRLDSVPERMYVLRFRRDYAALAARGDVIDAAVVVFAPLPALCSVSPCASSSLLPMILT